ncbi:alpha/beta fold hydrolase [Streptomonospora nanhaiensis]|uniref:alpha/beta fold hydrolase n=1 Tax=Streptomonospora nanhaiensis TaxID=1323731 RepID=UPI001C995878|nr:alpha/beta fold hydrolase [Streptomonospora nanhaiensis]MBX9390175.1 alpha/beta hydrolase [Streptomonospora nanhaiensis]
MAENPRPTPRRQRDPVARSGQDGRRERRWRRRPRTRTLAIAAVAVIALLAAALVVRQPAPVGHFTSGPAKTEFAAAYRTAMAELPEPDAVHDLRTDFGVVRAYHFDGPADGVPLVLLPGRAAASPVWADNLPSLLRHRDVYTVDLLGEPGMSLQDRPITSDADQARWLHQAVRALPEERVHLLGLSIGGWTAVNLAMREPAGIAGVALVDPVYVFDGMPLETVVRSVPASVPWLPRSWRESFNSYTAGGAPADDSPQGALIEAGMRTYALRLPQPGQIPEERLAGLRPPVLAVLAGESVMHDPATAEAAARRALPDDRVKVYPDASHAINGEYPEEVAADVGAFLDAVE